MRKKRVKVKNPLFFEAMISGETGGGGSATARQKRKEKAGR